MNVASAVQEIIAKIKDMEEAVTELTQENETLKAQLAAAKEERRALVSSVTKIQGALSALLAGEKT